MVGNHGFWGADSWAPRNPTFQLRASSVEQSEEWLDTHIDPADPARSGREFSMRVVWTQPSTSTMGRRRWTLCGRSQMVHPLIEFAILPLQPMIFSRVSDDFMDHNADETGHEADERSSPLKREPVDQKRVNRPDEQTDEQAPGTRNAVEPGQRRHALDVARRAQPPFPAV